MQAPGRLRYCVASMLLMLGACSDESNHDTVTPQDGGAEGSNGVSVIDEQTEKLLSEMTLDEKLALMAGVGIEQGLWITPGVPRLGIDGYRMTDGPRGMAANKYPNDRAQKGTAFPVGMARGATWDEDLEARVAEAIGRETRAWGGNVILAPVVNVLRHPAWGRAQETYGEDAVHVGRMGVAFVEGAQRQVIASVKHFAVNDIEDTRFTVNVTVDERTLREVFLRPFKLTVDAGVGSVMSAYNKVNGQYCAENAHLLTDILKNEWQFEGFVESDWIWGVYSTAPSANAGLDIEMPSPNYFSTQNLRAALDAGEVTESVIDGAVRRIVRQQLLLESRADPAVPPLDTVGSSEHAALALEAAHKSIVLLKNEAGALPLDRNNVTTIAVVGKFAAIARMGDLGSSDVQPSHAVTPLQGLEHRAGAVTLQHIDADVLTAVDEATIAASDAAVVFVGLSEMDEGENLTSLNQGGGDRDTLALSAEHEALVRAVGALNTRTIAVVEAGSAITMDAWTDSVSAILFAWYPGQEGGDAIADILFGAVNPSGRLPVTFPVAEADLPPFDHTSNEVTYDYFHGYRYLDRRGTAPLFAFGFGLSYTTFAYEGMVLTDSVLAEGGSIAAAVSISNTGTVAGDEVVQLYVGFPASTVEHAPRNLEAFSRVHLEAGETKRVSLSIAANDLRYYDVTTSSWRLAPGTYTAYVGSSSRDLPLSASFEVR